MKTSYLQEEMIQKRIDKDKKMSLLMKAIALLLLFTVAFCSLRTVADMKIAWCIYLPIVWVIFYADLNRALEPGEQAFRQLEKELREEKIFVTDTTMDKINYPLIYYIILSVVNVIGIIYVFTR